MPPPRPSDKPVAGFYLVRMVRGGPYVGAAIRYSETDGWTVNLDGEVQGPSHEPWSLSFMEKVAFWGRPCTEAEVQYRIGVKRWAEIYKPDHDAANPTRPLNLDTIVPF
jgi:hypothetical protein